jgi:spore coat polysaccharide biosynthesis protein SpsF (cytidylyltransferase family)
VWLDVEIYPAARMEELHRSGRLSAAHREHLTLFFYEHRDEFVVRPIEPRSDWLLIDRQFTIDTREDYAMARSLVARLGRGDFSIGDLLATAR